MNELNLRYLSVDGNLILQVLTEVIDEYTGETLIDWVDVPTVVSDE